MKFESSPIAGAFLIAPDPMADERGHFARTWCEREFQDAGIGVRWVQAGHGFSARAGTLRGLHYQVAPHAEVKLVRCSRGAIYDVLVDLRPDSPGFLQWTAVELSAANGLLVLVPEGVAHGYQTLVDETEVAYLLSAAYEPDSARGVRWDDPRVGIGWPPCALRIIGDRDLSFPDIAP